MGAGGPCCSPASAPKQIFRSSWYCPKAGWMLVHAQASPVCQPWLAACLSKCKCSARAYTGRWSTLAYREGCRAALLHPPAFTCVTASNVTLRHGMTRQQPHQAISAHPGQPESCCAPQPPPARSCTASHSSPSAGLPAPSCTSPAPAVEEVAESLHHKVLQQRSGQVIATQGVQPLQACSWLHKYSMKHVKARVSNAARLDAGRLHVPKQLLVGPSSRIAGGSILRAAILYCGRDSTPAQVLKWLGQKRRREPHYQAARSAGRMMHCQHGAGQYCSLADTGRCSLVPCQVPGRGLQSVLMRQDSAIGKLPDASSIAHLLHLLILLPGI